MRKKSLPPSGAGVARDEAGQVGLPGGTRVTIVHALIATACS